MTPRPRLKICGITRPEDAALAVSLGADALGFVFWADSPRRVSIDVARAIARDVGPLVTRVGVFVNAGAAEVSEIVRAVGLDAVQLHGDETVNDFGHVRARLIKAVSLATDADVERAASLPAGVTVLVDALDRTKRGGTGRAADWDRAAALAARRPVILAGGLTAANIADAIGRVQPWGVDVSSGIETAPGIKSRERMSEFVDALRKTSGVHTRSSFPMSTPEVGRRDPDARGYFGEFGGRFVPETLVAPVEELRAAYHAARVDPEFVRSLRHLLTTYVGRPTPLYEAQRTVGDSGVRLFLKREDLAHTGAHKINNAIGQALLAQRMGKRRIVAETGAGQHGVATATACALLGLDCVVYMGAEDMARQALNVFRMRVLGASVERVDAGSRTLKDAINEAMRDWVTNVETTYYLLGSVLGPDPYPLMVREFQSVIGHEARTQILDACGRLPDLAVACVGGGSNSLGLFDAFIDDPTVRLVGVEAGGRGIRPGEHAARFAGGQAGVLHGTRSLVLQDQHGNILPTHSVSAGLDYPSIGPEHAWLAARGRSEYVWVDDQAALEAFEWLGRMEGVLPALESAHAIAWIRRELPSLARGTVVLLNLSGRGDKDVDTVRKLRGSQD